VHSDEDKIYIKIVAFNEIYNFVVQTFFIWNHLEPGKNDILLRPELYIGFSDLPVHPHTTWFHNVPDSEEWPLKLGSNPPLAPACASAGPLSLHAVKQGVNNGKWNAYLFRILMQIRKMLNSPQTEMTAWIPSYEISMWKDLLDVCTLFAWLISHQLAVFFSQNKPANSN
jgi:hypothetical protein